MRVRLAYGREGLEVDLPDSATVVRPVDLPAVEDEVGAVRSAVRRALDASDLPGTVRRVAVVFPDITRPMPNRTVLPPVLAELRARGWGPEEVTLLCATGTHRAATAAELAELVGDEILATYTVHQHDATDAAHHVEVGAVDGVPVMIDRAWVDADIGIVTGFVEPHFFAGFSGGPKGVCPGLAALETVLEAHHPRRIADRRATWTELDGNPVHDFVRAATALAPPACSVDVAINRAREVTAVFAGRLPDSHREACAFVGRTSVQQVARRYDVVVSTNAGYPLDRNLYQAVKGMAAGERIVAPGGQIVMAAACEDGLPSGGAFANILGAVANTAELLDTDVPPSLDYWQAQVLARVLDHAGVSLYSGGLDDAEIRGAHLDPISDVGEVVRRAGPEARVAVLPEGPLTVASAPRP